MNTAGSVGVVTTITAAIVGASLAVLITRHCAKTGEPFILLLISTVNISRPVVSVPTPARNAFSIACYTGVDTCAGRKVRE